MNPWQLVAVAVVAFLAGLILTLDWRTAYWLWLHRNTGPK